MISIDPTDNFTDDAITADAQKNTRGQTKERPLQVQIIISYSSMMKYFMLTIGHVYF